MASICSICFPSSKSENEKVKSFVSIWAFQHNLFCFDNTNPFRYNNQAMTTCYVDKKKPQSCKGCVLAIWHASDVYRLWPFSQWINTKLVELTVHFSLLFTCM